MLVRAILPGPPPVTLGMMSLEKSAQNNIVTVENYLGHFLEKLEYNMEKVQTNAPATKGRASRAPFAGNVLYFFQIYFFVFFPKMAQVVFHTCCLKSTKYCRRTN